MPGSQSLSVATKERSRRDREIGVVAYLDGSLAGAYADKVEPYRLGLAALDRAANVL